MKLHLTVLLRVLFLIAFPGITFADDLVEGESCSCELVTYVDVLLVGSGCNAAHRKELDKFFRIRGWDQSYTCGPEMLSCEEAYEGLKEIQRECYRKHAYLKPLGPLNGLPLRLLGKCKAVWKVSSDCLDPTE